MSSALRRPTRDAPPPYQRVHVPPLASPLQLSSSCSVGGHPPFPPRRQFRYERFASAAMPPPSPPFGPLASTTPSPLGRPKTPPNNFPTSSSPPPAPKQTRTWYSPAPPPSAPSAEPIMYSISRVAKEPQSKSIATLLDAAFRRSAGRIQAELSNMRNFCAKVMASKLACDKADSLCPDSPASFDSTDIILEEPLDNPQSDETSLVNSPPYEEVNIPSPSTTYYSLSPSNSRFIDALDELPQEAPPSFLARTSSATLSPILPLQNFPMLPDFTAPKFDPLQPTTRGKKRKRVSTPIDDALPVSKRPRIEQPSTELRPRCRRRPSAALELDWDPALTSSPPSKRQRYGSSLLLSIGKPMPDRVFLLDYVSARND